MQTCISDGDVAQFEDALNAITLDTWNRTRTDEELQSFIDTHHDAVADAEV